MCVTRVLHGFYTGVTRGVTHEVTCVGREVRERNKG